MALPSTPPLDLPSSAAVPTITTSTTTTTATNPPTVRRFQNPSLPLRPQSQQPHFHHHPQPSTYPLPSPHFYTTQPIPNLAHRQPTNSIRSQSPGKPHNPSTGILYPVASSGRGFLPKGVRPQSVDQTVMAGNPGGFPPRPVAYAHPHTVRPYGFPHHDPQGQVVHHIRSTHLQHSLMGSAGGVMPGVVRGVPVPAVSVHPKVVPSHPPVSDSNGFKDMRDRSKDDGLVTVRHRKVRISEGSLYSLCRSWLRNGVHEENQQQYFDGVKLLPRPSRAPVKDEDLPVEMGGDKEDDKEEGSVEDLSPEELLQRHINRAKRVRARLREVRLQRIARYRTRLSLLLPPLAENQQLRNDMAARWN